MAERHCPSFGDRVTIHYRLTRDDGVIVVDTFNDSPVDYCIGDGELPEGFDLLLYGLSEGERKTQQLTPLMGWGGRDPQSVITLSTAELDMLSPPYLHQTVTLEQDGQYYYATIIAEDDDSVEADFNSPLAGHDVTVDVKLLRIHP